MKHVGFEKSLHWGNFGMMVGGSLLEMTGVGTAAGIAMQLAGAGMMFVSTGVQQHDRELRGWSLVGSYAMDAVNMVGVGVGAGFHYSLKGASASLSESVRLSKSARLSKLSTLWEDAMESVKTKPFDDEYTTSARIKNAERYAQIETLHQKMFAAKDAAKEIRGGQAAQASKLNIRFKDSLTDLETKKSIGKIGVALVKEAPEMKFIPEDLINEPVRTVFAGKAQRKAYMTAREAAYKNALAGNKEDQRFLEFLKEKETKRLEKHQNVLDLLDYEGEMKKYLENHNDVLNKVSDMNYDENTRQFNFQSRRESIFRQYEKPLREYEGKIARNRRIQRFLLPGVKLTAEIGVWAGNDKLTEQYED